MLATPTPTISTPYSFPVSLVEKLYNSNYLHSRQQVEPITKWHRLQLFVANPTISPGYPHDKDHYVDHMNTAYEVWEVQDQMLFTLLQSMLSKLILSCIIGDTLLLGLGHNSWILLSLDKVPAWQLHIDLRCRCIDTVLVEGCYDRNNKRVLRIEKWYNRKIWDAIVKGILYLSNVLLSKNVFPPRARNNRKK